MIKSIIIAVFITLGIAMCCSCDQKVDCRALKEEIELSESKMSYIHEPCEPCVWERDRINRLREQLKNTNCE